MGIVKVKRVMFVVAHPDDETLMGGGFIARCKREGWPVAVVTIAADASARGTGSGPELIANRQGLAFNYLGIQIRYNYTGQDSNIINENHLEAVQFIENAIKDWQPDIIITHFPEDNHSDHRCVSRATQEAFRYFQRPRGEQPCEELWFGEVPSSTDWSVSDQFRPNIWVPLMEGDLNVKIKALEMYHEVIRPVPHPRSEKNIRALATVRGSQSGFERAEAFQQVFRVF